MVDGEVAGIEYQASALVDWCEGAVQQHDTTGKTRRLMTIGCDIATTLGDACPPRPNRQVGQRQGSGCSACAGPVAGGSHEASEPGQKGFERHGQRIALPRGATLAGWAGAHEGKNPDRGILRWSKWRAWRGAEQRCGDG